MSESTGRKPTNEESALLLRANSFGPRRALVQALFDGGEKWCGRCDTIKPVTEYHKGPKNNGLQPRCKACCKEYSNLPAAVATARKATRKARRTVMGRANTLYHSAKRRAKKARIVFTLTREWLDPIIESGVCQVTGVPFNFEPSGEMRTTNPRSPSLDKRVPFGGYTQENTQVTLWAYNRLKGDMTDDEAITLIHEMSERLQEKGL